MILVMFVAIYSEAERSVGLVELKVKTESEGMKGAMLQLPSFPRQKETE